MAHTKPEDLRDLEQELEALRALQNVREKSKGVFYYKSLPFLHFHDKDGARWADLKLKGGGRTIAIDDKLDRFGEFLARAWVAARKADVGISDATHHNLMAAGLLPKDKA